MVGKMAKLALIVLTLMTVTCGSLLLVPEARESIEIAAGAERYGQPLPWDEVKLLFPRYTAAFVKDLETGKRFEVERRGGTYHADVQPLTEQDTRILKEIYGNEWSWKRRAVIVEAGLKKIAASMNGMPHGSGKIKANNFPGHFCLHFQGSKVHKSSKVDPAHRMMIWKAAGQPVKPFMEAGPREAVELVITAINQDDAELAALGIKPAESEDLWIISQGLIGRLPEIDLRNIREREVENEVVNSEFVKYLARIKLLYPGDKTIFDKEGELIVRHDKLAGRWLLEGRGLIELLDPKLSFT